MQRVGVVESSFPCLVPAPKNTFSGCCWGAAHRRARAGLFEHLTLACLGTLVSMRQRCSSALHACHLSAEMALPEQMASHQTAVGPSWQNGPYVGSASCDMLEILGRTTWGLSCPSKAGPVFFCASTASSDASLSFCPPSLPKAKPLRVVESAYAIRRTEGVLGWLFCELELQWACL
jgi:hypothetical protein